MGNVLRKTKREERRYRLRPSAFTSASSPSQVSIACLRVEDSDTLLDTIIIGVGIQ